MSFTDLGVRGVTLGRWSPIWASFLPGAAQAVVHLAIGYVLRTEAAEAQARSRRPEPRAA